MKFQATIHVPHFLPLKNLITRFWGGFSAPENWIIPGLNKVRADNRRESMRRRATFHESVYVVVICRLIIGMLIKVFI